MSLNQLLILIAIKPLGKRLMLMLSFVLLNACQSLPLLQWADDPRTAVKHEFSLIEKQSVLGQAGVLEIEAGDSLPVIARYFGLGFDEIILANPDVDPWLPEQGHTVSLPLRFILPKVPRKGLVLNLAAKRLFYFPGDKNDKVITFPIGIGREGWQTPTGTTSVIAKKVHPRWVVPKSIRLEHAKKGDPLPKIVPAGPNNPLGDYALRLGIPGYLIHGTNKPYGVGMAVSHGCVRLYPEDIALLFKQIKTGTQVRLLNQPFLIGENKGELYIQVYPQTHTGKKQSQTLLAAFKKKLKRIERNSKRHIDWRQVDATILRSDGIPVTVFADSVEKETVARFTHPPELNRKIKPASLTDEFWRIKVAEFAESNSARRLAVILNHQGPPIPAHVLPVSTGFIVVAGPFNSVKEAQASVNRLRIDFALRPELIQPSKIIPELQETAAFFSRILSILDWTSN